MNASLYPGTLADIRDTLIKAEKAWGKGFGNRYTRLHNALVDLRSLLTVAEQFALADSHTPDAVRQRLVIVRQWQAWLADYGADL